jgi:hypothetical protein
MLCMQFCNNTIYPIPMLKTKLFFLFFYCILNFTIAQAQTENTKPPQTDTTAANKYNTLTLTVEHNYMQTYLWRAITFGSDDVMQPYVQASYKNFFVQLACNLNVIPKNLPTALYSKQVFYDEQDFQIGYGNNIKKLDYEVKIDSYRYFYQPTSPSTTEFNVKLEHPIVKNLSAVVENVIDIEAYKGSFYNNTALVYNKEIKNFAFSISGCAGLGNKKFNETYFFGESGGLFFLGGKADVTYNFKNNYIRFMIERYSYSKDDIKTATEKNGSGNFQVAFGKNFEFKIKKRKQ